MYYPRLNAHAPLSLVAKLAVPVSLVLLVPQRASAQTAAASTSVASPAGALDDAQADFDRARDELASLTSLKTDCAITCRALESMKRAADRLCELDAGERCSKARAKVADAMARVREACPDCAAARQEERPREAVATSAKLEAAQPRRSGGCAGCEIGARRDDQNGQLALFGAALSTAIVRRQLRRRRSAAASPKQSL